MVKSWSIVFWLFMLRKEWVQILVCDSLLLFFISFTWLIYSLYSLKYRLILEWWTLTSWIWLVKILRSKSRSFLLWFNACLMKSVVHLKKSFSAFIVFNKLQINFWFGRLELDFNWFWNVLLERTSMSHVCHWDYLKFLF